MKWGPKDAGVLIVDDVNWATSDQPILVTSDGAVRIYVIIIMAVVASRT